MKHTSLDVRALFLSAMTLALLFLLLAEPAYAQKLENPLAFNTISEFIAGALRVLVMVALPIITLFIVVAGFLFISARGNSSKLEEAKKNFVYVVLGTLLILGAWVIATLIAGTISQLMA